MSMHELRILAAEGKLTLVALLREIAERMDMLSYIDTDILRVEILELEGFLPRQQELVSLWTLPNNSGNLKLCQTPNWIIW